MKYLYTVISILIANCLSAQLSGVYKIGGTSPDYVDISAAISDLQSQGVSGPVRFDIRAGTYNGRYVINEIPGASNNNNIIIQSEASDVESVTLTSDSASASSDNYIFLLDSADYITIRYLKFISTNPDYTTMISLMNKANRNAISNNLFDVSNATASTSNNIIFVDQAILGINLNNDTVSILNNTFLGGYYGIYWRSYSTGGARSFYLSVNNNSFFEQYKGGMELSGQRYLTVNENNVICNDTNNIDYTGIHATQGYNDVTISGNYVYINKPYNNATGIKIDNFLATTGTNDRLLSNNMIYVKTTQRAYGIVAYNFIPNGIKVYNNTCAVYSPSAPTGPLYYTCAKAYFEDANGGSDSIKLFNNIFANLGPQGYAIHFKDSGGVGQIFNNNAFFSASGELGRWDLSVLASDLTAWQAITGQDNNSFYINPQFYSDSNLHVCNDTLNGVGLSLPDVTLDFDGQSRNSSAPDIGADEFNTYAIVNAKNDTLIHLGDPVQLFATGGLSYSWMPVSGLNNPNIFNPIANTLVPKTYYVTATDFCGFEGVDSVRILIGVNLSGKVFKESLSDTIKSGMVNLLKKNNQGSFVFDKQSTVNPDGSFSTGLLVLDKEYMLRAIPNESLYSNVFKTYYPDKVIRDSADIIIVHSDTSSFNIFCKELPVLENGTGKIWGQVREGNFSGKIQGPGDPLDGADVSLIDKSASSIIGQTTSQPDTSVGDSGIFQFEQLASDVTYNLYVDINGIPVDAGFDLNITSTVQEIYVIVIVDSTGISFEDSIPNTNISSVYPGLAMITLFPNPAKDVFYTHIETKDEQSVTYRLMNMQGQILEQDFVDKLKGVYELSIYTSKYTSGTYLLSVQIGSQLFQHKIMIE